MQVLRLRLAKKPAKLRSGSQGIFDASFGGSTLATGLAIRLFLCKKRVDWARNGRRETGRSWLFINQSKIRGYFHHPILLKGPSNF
jgi:hypothetical protein